MSSAMKADLLIYATLADDFFQFLADIPIVDFAENRIVLLETVCTFRLSATEYPAASLGTERPSCAVWR